MRARVRREAGGRLQLAGARGRRPSYPAGNRPEARLALGIPTPPSFWARFAPCSVLRAPRPILSHPPHPSHPYYPGTICVPSTTCPAPSVRVLLCTRMPGQQRCQTFLFSARRAARHFGRVSSRTRSHIWPVIFLCRMQRPRPSQRLRDQPPFPICLSAVAFGPSWHDLAKRWPLYADPSPVSKRFFFNRVH